MFGFYDSDGETIVPMEKQEYYLKDTFGLRTLDDSDRLTLKNVPGKVHVDWLFDSDLIEEYVLPCLED